MPRSDDVQLTGRVDLTTMASAAAVAAPVMAPSPIPNVALPSAECTCEEFRRNHVCDHVLMAAAVRMVRRMIDIHADPEKPH